MTEDPWSVVLADCIDHMRKLADSSVDSIVTDPPYGLEFMGKDWDKLSGGDVGKLSHSGFSDGSFKGMVLASYNAAANVKCRSCGKWKWDYPGRKCECTSPDFPNLKAIQAVEMQRWHQAWASEAFRVLKPGGHLLAFGGSRTYHRLACAIEDAGFEIRDEIDWVYSTGFPKSMSIAKAIDKQEGTEGEVLGTETVDVGMQGGHMHSGRPRKMATREIRAPSPQAEPWVGWGTALKPAHEPIVVARKPVVGSVADNILAYRTGGMNIDGTRVGFVSEDDHEEAAGKNRHADFGSVARTNAVYGRDTRPRGLGGNWDPPGRWPTNLLLTHSPACRLVGSKVVSSNGHYSDEIASGYGDGIGRETGGSRVRLGPGESVREERVEAWECAPGCPVAELDRQAPPADPKAERSGLRGGSPVFGAEGIGSPDETGTWPADPGGGPSRFFPAFSWDTEELAMLYEPKASRSEREAGLAPPKPANALDGPGDAPGRVHTEGPMAGRGDGIKPVGLKCRRCGKWKVSGAPCTCPDPDFETVPFDRPKIANTHPTVKPIAMMRWLVRLVTPPRGLVLDPFAGSGSTGCAAVADGFRFLGIDANPEYVEIARARIRYWAHRPARAPTNPVLKRRSGRAQRRLSE